MANIVTVEANALLDASLGAATYTAPTGAIKLRLMTANGSASAAGTEVTGGSYASQTITFSGASAGSAANSGAISFTGMPACTVTGIELWDSAGTPVRRWFGSLTASKTVGAGDTLSFATSSISISLS